ncbi:hypothetical protein EDC94DRAFT_615102 [Helicostylum pulchrum]|nr:hypothetical protein EDC94DRAFT_615102 [Helicostylum pulchrum]
MKKFPEGRGSWYELRFAFQKFEIISASVISNKTNEIDRLDAFFGVAVLSMLGLITNFMYFSTVRPAETVSHSRMLRKYRKDASLKPWYIKSSLFNNMYFGTPLRLYSFQTESQGYISICSKLLHFTTYEIRGMKVSLFLGIIVLGTKLFLP